MGSAPELTNYLPLSFKKESEREYIKYLWEAFELSYQNGKYQFAFLAYHMLTMSFVYFKIWQIRQNEPLDFEKALIGFSKDTEKDLLGASSPFDFSIVNERSILRLLKLIACDDGMIGRYTKLVDDRNDTAHPNGHIFYSEPNAIGYKITEILRAVEEIQTLSKPVIEHCYRNFLLTYHDTEERAYRDTTDLVRGALIHQNYLSHKDIEICLGFNISGLSTFTHYGKIAQLHDALVSEYRHSEE
jgi:hypothetical protein